MGFKYHGLVLGEQYILMMWKSKDGLGRKEESETE